MPSRRFSRWLNQGALWDDAAPNSSIPFYRGIAPGQDPLKPSPLGALFITPSQEEAKVFAGPRGRVVELRLASDNIFDGTKPEDLERAGFDADDISELTLWKASHVENPSVMAQIRQAGFDGFYCRDWPAYPKGFWNVAVFDPTLVKTVGGQR
jgi:hypothetical protein